MTVEALVLPETDIPQMVDPILSHIVIGEDTCAGYIMVRVALYVNKFEVPFHFCSHAFRVARELLPDVLLECSSSPTSHFLNLCVRIA